MVSSDAWKGGLLVFGRVTSSMSGETAVAGFYSLFLPFMSELSLILVGLFTSLVVVEGFISVIVAEAVIAYKELNTNTISKRYRRGLWHFSVTVR